jgi:hypothetical protein
VEEEQRSRESTDADLRKRVRSAKSVFLELSVAELRQLLEAEERIKSLESENDRLTKELAAVKRYVCVQICSARLRWFVFSHMRLRKARELEEANARWEEHQRRKEKRKKK